MSSRSQIRQKIRQQRRALDDSQRKIATSEFFYRLINTSLFRNSQRIACYLACDGEIDIERVMYRAWQMKKTVYLPVLDGMNRSRLWFAPFAKDSHMVLNQYGIPEPVVSQQKIISASELDLMLLPLVAFDDKGNRLGMGGGYYDRTLAYIKRRNIWKKPHVVGVAYEFQQVSELKSECWDVPLQCIVTDRNVFMAR